MIGNRKEERRVWTVPLHVIRKAQHPVRIDWLQFWTKKAGIHTGPAQTECHRSTTCATTTSTTWLFKLEITSCAVGCWQGWVMLLTAQVSFEAPRVKIAGIFLNNSERNLSVTSLTCCTSGCTWFFNQEHNKFVHIVLVTWSVIYRSAATIAQPQVEHFDTRFCFDRQKKLTSYAKLKSFQVPIVGWIAISDNGDLADAVKWRT